MTRFEFSILSLVQGTFVVVLHWHHGPKNLVPGNRELKKSQKRQYFDMNWVGYKASDQSKNEITLTF